MCNILYTRPIYKAISLGSLFLFLSSYPLPNREEPNPKQEKVTNKRTNKKTNNLSKKATKEKTQKTKSPLTKTPALTILFLLSFLEILLYHKLKKWQKDNKLKMVTKHLKEAEEYLRDCENSVNQTENTRHQAPVWEEKKEAKRQFRHNARKVFPTQEEEESACDNSLEELNIKSSKLYESKEAKAHRKALQKHKTEKYWHDKYEEYKKSLTSNKDENPQQNLHTASNLFRNDPVAQIKEITFIAAQYILKPIILCTIIFSLYKAHQTYHQSHINPKKAHHTKNALNSLPKKPSLVKNKI